MLARISVSAKSTMLFCKIAMSLLLATFITTFSSCDDDPVPPSGGVGSLVLAFDAAQHLDGPINAPAFFGYTLRMPDGSVLVQQETLYYNAETDEVVMMPRELNAGHYVLEQFVVLNSVEEVVYAAPVEGSMMSGHVQHPLSVSFEIKAGESTEVVSDVVAIECHLAEDFGYAEFGHAIPERLSFDVTATVADPNAPEAGSYTLYVLAKGSLGNLEWSDTLSISNEGTVCIPGYHARYSFVAEKEGYITHEQHFWKAELAHYGALAFEFIPESLEGFIVRDLGYGITAYFPDDANRCRLYARVDLPEGYRINYLLVDRNATTEGGFPLGAFLIQEHVLEGTVYTFVPDRHVNLFGNKPFIFSDDYCSMIELTHGDKTYTLAEVEITSFLFMDVDVPGENPPTIAQAYQWWD